MTAQPNLSSSNLQSIIKSLHLASQYYMEAVDCFAEDDENHACASVSAINLIED